MTKECSQEPVLTHRDLSASGVNRYFQGWPSRTAGVATIWEVGAPEKLHALFMQKRRHQGSGGCCKLHVKTGARVGRNVLMMQLPFKAWHKHSTTGRISLVVELRVTRRGGTAVKGNCSGGDLADVGSAVPAEPRPARTCGKAARRLGDGGSAANRAKREAGPHGGEQHEQRQGQEQGSGGEQEQAVCSEAGVDGDRGGVGNGGRGGGQPRALSVAIINVKLSTYDVISITMRGGGRMFPAWPRKLVFRASIGNRSRNSKTSTAAAAAEIKLL
eukprot:6213009-Pleurochrysis_carterae.AAC.4